MCCGGVLLQAGDHVEHALGVAVCGVHEQCVNACLDQGHCALVAVAEEADSGAGTQAAVLVLGGVGVLLSLDEVLQGNQTGELACVIDQGQTLNLVVGQQRECFVLGDAGVRGDQRHGGHDVADANTLVVGAGDVADIAVGDDTFQHALFADDGQTGDLVVAADLVVFGDGCVSTDGDGVNDHAGLGALHAVHVCRLVLDGEVAVDNAHTAQTCHSDCHRGVGHGVHCGGDDGGVQGDALRQAGGGVRIGGDDVGVAGQQQHVIVGQAGEAERILGQSGGNGHCLPFGCWLHR